MPVTTDLKAAAIDYLEAAGNKDYGAVSGYLAPGVRFKGPMSSSESADELIAGLKRMAPIWARNEVREVFVSGNRVCATYDFVTTTPLGALPCVEVLSFDGDRISAVELFFDPAQFAPAAQPIGKSAAK